MYTTLNRIRQRSPCTDGWKKLLNHLGKTKPDDEPLPLLTILNSNGFDHTLWCFRAVDGFEKEKQLLAITFARGVEHLMPAESKKALEVFEQYVNGLATQEEFETAREAARSAAADAYGARAACAAADAADAYATASAATAVCAVCAADAAWAAAAADDAARTAVYAAAADAADAAAHAAQISDAASDIYSTIRAKQENQLRQLLEKSCTQL